MGGSGGETGGTVMSIISNDVTCTSGALLGTADGNIGRRREALSHMTTCREKGEKKGYIISYGGCYCRISFRTLTTTVELYKG